MLQRILVHTSWVLLTNLLVRCSTKVVHGFVPSSVAHYGDTHVPRRRHSAAQTLLQDGLLGLRRWTSKTRASDVWNGEGLSFQRSTTRKLNTRLFASRKNRGSFSWDEDVLERRVKDMLVERAIDTAECYWSETGGEIYRQWLGNFAKELEMGEDVVNRLGWARYLLKMMEAEPEEAVVVRTAIKDSDEVIAAREKNNARPPTLHPWRHTVNQLSADWDEEEMEEMRVELDHPPQLESLKKEVVVQPVDVAKRIMAIREQLAVEWTEDLANIEVENEEIKRLEKEMRQRAGEDAADPERRLTYDHGEAFGGDSTPFRADNYETLVSYLTEIGALAVQEKMRIGGDEMGWQWMEQFLYWTKANSKSGSAGGGSGANPPRRPSASRESGRSIGGEGAGARGKEVSAMFGATGGGMGETEDEKKMRGNRLLEEMMAGPKVQVVDTKTGEMVGVDPPKICGLVMAARLGVAERIKSALQSVPADHGLVLRRYLEGKWKASPGEEEEVDAEGGGGVDSDGDDS